MDNDDSRKYTVALIAQKVLEFKAATALFDEDYGIIYLNAYKCHKGRLGNHNVVLGLQLDGSEHHTRITKKLVRTISSAFPEIAYLMFVGTGDELLNCYDGGVQIEVKLGDIIVFFQSDSLEEHNEHDEDEDTEDSDDEHERHECDNEDGGECDVCREYSSDTEQEDCPDGDQQNGHEGDQKDNLNETRISHDLLETICVLRSRHDEVYSTRITCLSQEMRTNAQRDHDTPKVHYHLPAIEEEERLLPRELYMSRSLVVRGICKYDYSNLNGWR
jgi:hypothetical protein